MNLTRQIEPLHILLARMTAAGLLFLSLAGGWLSVLNITRSGAQLLTMFGGWFRSGWPASVLFLIIAIVIIVGIWAGLKIGVELSYRALEERRMTLPLGLLIGAIIALTVWVFANPTMQTLMVILAPGFSLAYGLLSLSHGLWPDVTCQRWPVTLLIVTGACLWAGLIWVLNGSGGYGHSGWGFWLTCLVLLACSALEGLEYIQGHTKPL